MCGRRMLRAATRAAVVKLRRGPLGAPLAPAASVPGLLRVCTQPALARGPPFLAASASSPAEVSVYRVELSPCFQLWRLRYDDRSIMTPAAAAVMPNRPEPSV